MTEIEQLSGDDQAVIARLGLDLNVELIGISSIKHLSCPYYNRTSSGHGRLPEAVEQDLDNASGLLLWLRHARRGEHCFGQAHGNRWRLITGLCGCRFADLLP